MPLLRRLLVVVAVIAMLATFARTAAADVVLDVHLPLPALPIGPGPLYPLDAYGPTPGDNVVLRWDDEQTLAAIRASKTGPTINARALAIVHTAIYDAWAAYDPTAVGTRLAGSLRRPAAERTLAYKSTAISYAAYRALLNLFPARVGDFRAFMTALGYDPDDAATDPATPAGSATPRPRRCSRSAPTTAPTRRAATPTPPATSRSTRRTRSTTRSTGSRCACPTATAGRACRSS